MVTYENSQPRTIWMMALDHALPIISVGICTLIVFLHFKQYYLRKCSEVNHGDMSDDELEAKHRQFNDKSCMRCCSPFNEELVKKLLCHLCKYYICQNCATIDSERRCWTCKYCQHSEPIHPPPQVELYQGLQRRCRQFQSAKLLKSFYKSRRDSDSENENDSGYVPSLSAASSWDCSLQQRKIPLDLTNLEEESSVDLTALKVREHIEDIVEKFLEDTLDSAPLDNIYNHPEYEKIFLKYHGTLRELLEQLTKSLQMAINNEPLENEETPSTIHSSLQAIVKELTDDAMRLPKMAEVNSQLLDTSSDEDDIANQSYESILSTAIINKAIDSFQRGLDGSNYSMTSLDDNFETEHDGMDTENADYDFSWAKGIGDRRSPIAIKIEEHIEEVTTTINEFDSDDELDIANRSQEPKVTRTFMRKEKHLPELENLYAGLGFAESHKVPFPELGVDIVAADYPQPQVGVEAINFGVMMSSVESWEENWMFKKKKKVTPFRNALGTIVIGEDPVAMLVPKPQMDVKVKVGERNIDELSDMSEGNSVSSVEDFEDTDSDLEVTQENGDDLLPQTVKNTMPEIQNGRPNCEPKKEIPANDKSDRLRKMEEILEKTVKPHLVKPTEMEKPKIETQNAHSGKSRIKFVPIANRRNKSSEISIVSMPDVVNVIVGKAARITCVVKSPSVIEVAWYFGCELLQNDDKYLMHKKDDEHHLEIYNTDSNDSGTYSCMAYNSSGECWRDFTLAIKGQLKNYSPPSFTKKPKNICVETGREAIFSCKVLGVPEPRVTWYRNNRELVADKNISIEVKPQGEYILKVASTKKINFGEYTVIAENKLGQIKSSATLDIGDGKGKHLHYHPRSIEDDVDLPQKQTSTERSADSMRVDETDSVYLDKDREITEESLYNISPLTGTIAEREMRKWQNPVQLAHNPYSQESISKRLQKSNWLVADTANIQVKRDKIVKESEISPEETVRATSEPKEKRLTRYGRDYYISGGQQKWESPVNSRQNSTETIPEKARSLDETGKAAHARNKVVSTSSSLDEAQLRKPKFGTAFKKDLVSGLDTDVTQNNFERFGSMDRNLRNVNRVKKVDQDRRSSIDHSASPLKLATDQELVRAPSVQELAKMFSGAPVLTEPPLNTTVAKKLPIIKVTPKVDSVKEASVSTPGAQLRVRTPSNASTVSVSSVSERSVPQGALKSEVVEDWQTPLDDFIIGSSRSVKQLTLKFLEEQISEGGHGLFCAAASPVKRPLSAMAADDSHEPEVHSLTARSLTREFREAAKRNSPHRTNKALSSSRSDSDGSSISSPSSEKCSDGQDLSIPEQPSPKPRRNPPRKLDSPEVDSVVSDESSVCSSSSSAVSSTTDKCPSPVPKPRRIMAKSIEDMAAAWDRKVLEGDSSLEAFSHKNIEDEEKVTYL